MPSLLGLLKPEYVFQPRRLVRRLVTTRIPGGPGPYELRLPWGLSLEMRAFDGRAREIARLGVHDLVVTEAIWRLSRRGDTVIDAGANVGYMTVAMAARLGRAGRVFAFEPHPEIFEELEENVRRARARFPAVAITSRREALSESEGRAWLSTPEDWERTRGTARIAEGGAGFEIQTRRLDAFAKELGDVALMKIDVEGHEASLLRGAEEMLRSGQVRNVVFEEHGRYPTDATSLLERAGYTIFSLDRTLFGVHLGDPAHPRRTDWQPPNLLATRDPKAARDAFRAPGWRSL